MTFSLQHRYPLSHLVYALLPYLVLAALVWTEFSAILSLNHGYFTYSLDDPYIHLALAERIAHGFYGINPGEAAAPASSIIWPFLLAPLAWTSFFEYVPLAINLLLAAATVFVYAKIAGCVLADLPDDQRGPAASLLTVALIPTTNLVGLAFTGMEHSLQVFLCAVIVLGVIRVLRGRPTPGWLVAALIAAPLVRYETLTVALPAVLILLLCRRWKAGLAALSITAALLGAFSLFLHANGLGWLPTSVLAKVGSAGYRPTHNFIVDHIRYNLEMTQGPVLAGLMVACFLLAFIRRKASWTERILALAASAALLAHLSAGQIGWMDRYEVYAIAAGVLWVLYLGRGLFTALFNRLGTWAAVAVLFGLSMIIGGPYYANVETTPGASANIYEQQYQMHRFVIDYLKAPVAVNDIGWVAYRNPNYILDLWGLASKDALDSRTHSGPFQVDWMDRMVRQHNVRLVMIYADGGWFPAQPTSWTPVAKLHLGHRQVSAGGDTVTFFVTQPEDVERINALLEKFKTTLPDGVVLSMVDGSILR